MLIVRGCLMLALLSLSGMARAEDLTVFAAGDVAYCKRDPLKSKAARTAQLIEPGAPVLVMGDTVYPLATPHDLQNCYAPTWGRHLDTTLAAPGNHDYVDGRLDNFAQYFGEHAGPRGYLAKRFGSWLVIALDSNDRAKALDEQLRWLSDTLQASRSQVQCILALWHHPVFTSGLKRGDGEHMRASWDLLQKYRADIILNGHEHYYEAFEPRDTDGHFTAEGLREFIVGTGGAPLYPIWLPPVQSRARSAHHGVLRLRLQDGAYQWAFIDVAGKTRDAGSGQCHNKEPSDAAE